MKRKILRILLLGITFALLSSTTQGNWSEPITVYNTYAEESIRLSPKVVEDDDETLHLVWNAVIDGESRVFYACKEKEDLWEEPLELSIEITGNFYLTLDRSGRIYLVWQEQNDFFFSTKRRNFNWSTPQPLIPETARKWLETENWRSEDCLAWNVAFDMENTLHMIFHFTEKDDKGHTVRTLDWWVAKKENNDIAASPLPFIMKGFLREPVQMSAFLAADSANTLHYVYGWLSFGSHWAYMTKPEDGGWSKPVEILNKYEIDLFRAVLDSADNMHCILMEPVKRFDSGAVIVDCFYAVKSPEEGFEISEPVPLPRSTLENMKSRLFQDVEIDKDNGLHVVWSELSSPSTFGYAYKAENDDWSEPISFRRKGMGPLLGASIAPGKEKTHLVYAAAMFSQESVHEIYLSYTTLREEPLVEEPPDEEIPEVVTPPKPPEIPLNTEECLPIGECFFIIVMPSMGGTISPSGWIIVPRGESKKFTIASDSGYEIKDVIVNGKSLGPVETYTFTNVRAKNDITAIFEREREYDIPSLDDIIAQIGARTTKTYTITATAGQNGRIQPSGEMEMSPWGLLFIITPNNGYQVANFTIDGVSKLDEIVKHPFGSSWMYAFPEATADHKIHASFGLKADIDEDGVVGFSDLMVIIQKFGDLITAEHNSPNPSNPDVNGDGVVNLLDVVLVAKHFGETYENAAPAKDGLQVSPEKLAVLQEIRQILKALPQQDEDIRKAVGLINQIITLTETRSTAHTAILQNYPNPFNPETWIPYQLAEPANVVVQIYDAAGRIARTLDLGPKPAGLYSSKQMAAHWDGRNSNGEFVTSGVYFYTLQANDFTTTKKMILAK